MYKVLVALAAFVGISLFIINGVASVFYWYVSIWWFDMLMHVIGGIFVGLIGSAFLHKHLEGLSGKEVFVSLALFVFIIGLGWEYYEYILQFYIKSVQLADVADSISDLICDMVGGIIATLFVILLRKRYNH